MTAKPSAQKKKEGLLRHHFGADTAEIMKSINASIDIDRRLYKQDIAGSVAHGNMLVLQGLITEDDGLAITRGLEEVRKEIEAGSTIADLLARPEVETHGDPANDGELDLRKVVRARYPYLVDAAFRGSEGEWLGPVEILDRFAVFRVGSKTGGEVQPFSQARARAEAILAEKRKNEHIDALIKELREQRKDQIKLFTERLS